MQSSLYIHTPALPRVTKGNFSEVAQSGADCGGSTTTIFRGQREVPPSRGREPLEWLWRRGSLCEQLGVGVKGRDVVLHPLRCREWLPRPPGTQAGICLTSQESLSSGKLLPQAGAGSSGMGAVPCKGTHSSARGCWRARQLPVLGGGATKWERQENS